MAHQHRNPMVDFWRGVVLITIFVNHIPGNILENFTHRNFGFSDGAEAFVFLSGFAVALVHGGRAGQDPVGVMWRCLRRAVLLYRAHLILTASAIALFSAADVLGQLPALLEPHGRSAVFHDTSRGIAGILSLGHQLGYFNILPLYVVLMLWTPLALVLVRIHVGLAVAVSAFLYVLARSEGWNLPSWPEPGGWYFNPFAWQFLFTFGIAAGVIWNRRSIAYHPTTFWASVTIIVTALVVVTSGPGLWPDLWEHLRPELDMGKSELGLGRLTHFLALAYVLTHVPVARCLASTHPGRELQRLGRNALAVFAAGSILSALGEVIMTLSEVRYSASPHLIGMIYTFAGIAGLVVLARVSEWNTGDLSRQRSTSSVSHVRLSSLQQPS
jgi:hypothetical protein